MLLKKLIKNIPKEKEELSFPDYQQTVKKQKKIIFFLQSKVVRLNGEKFIDNAIANGASVIVCSKNCKIKKKVGIYFN